MNKINLKIIVLWLLLKVHLVWYKCIVHLKVPLAQSWLFRWYNSLFIDSKWLAKFNCRKRFSGSRGNGCWYDTCKLAGDDLPPKGVSSGTVLVWGRMAGAARSGLNQVRSSQWLGIVTKPKVIFGLFYFFLWSGLVWYPVLRAGRGIGPPLAGEQVMAEHTTGEAGHSCFVT